MIIFGEQKYLAHEIFESSNLEFSCPYYHAEINLIVCIENGFALYYVLVKMMTQWQKVDIYYDMSH